MHGLGNDFVIIDAVTRPVALTHEQIRFLADRHTGVGCDQLLMVEPATDARADFRYRIFNADGSESGQCGNGARCFARFVRERGLTAKDQLVLETSSGLLRTQLLDGNLVTVDMGAPRLEPSAVPFVTEQTGPIYSLEVGGDRIEICAVSMGNPHAVLLVEDVTSAPVDRLGPLIEHDAHFPQRVNVGFMEVQDRAHIRLRVFERGAGETLACGSGACAAVVAGRLRGLLDERVAVELPGGSLFVQWGGDGASVAMTGPATLVFEGTIAL
ncbi:MAG: diaminopimelate epimerase [Gammaproteobacteria bacterium]|nr:diaminopimelate epimerase [Gammaproteobacteria bacterium]